MANQGINHTEGGWPKDVTATDPEQTTRYRKKTEKDEQFAIQILSMADVRSDLLLTESIVIFFTVAEVAYYYFLISGNCERFYKPARVADYCDR